MTGSAAAFIDRDGVINVDRGYVSLWDDFEFLPGVVDALSRLQRAGYRLVIITNQSGIARGYYSEDTLLALNARLRQELEHDGIRLDGIYYCPHLKDAVIERYRQDCDCRKPRPGLIEAAARDLSIDLGVSFLIGDKPSDVDAGLAAGIPARYYVAGRDEAPPAAATAIVSGLAECADTVLASRGLAQ